MTANDYEAFQRALIEEIRTKGRPESGPMADRPLMVLTTIGAKSGQPHEAVVTYTRDGDDYIIAATKGGAPTNPAWYHNLRANPEVTIEANREAFRARATIVTGEERDRLYDQHADERPEFRDYPSRTPRVIPVVRLTRTGEAR